jgi:hypothetical protein
MQSRHVVRNVLKGVGVALVLIYVSGVDRSGWLLTLGLLSLFLGATDFGRQCPLILSVRHLAYRIKSRGNPPILSAEPVNEINKGDQENRLP